ncbi:MAG: hypothetical protein R3192_00715 [Woeseiaceae bacterium]|nr:hypothetical protein [Woeseiaceae bacterium]
MQHKFLVTALFAGAVLTACDSGDINIQPSTNVTDSNNTTTVGGGGGANDVCASYVNGGGQTLEGSYDGDNCTYSAAFASSGNNVTVDLTFQALPGGGAHIFEGSLFMGETYRSNADLAAAGISRGGDGPTLTIEAGATLAWQTSQDFLIINRGSQIIAVGTETDPITLTSVSDVENTVGPEDVQEWGGVVINGFAVTNKCAYTGTRGVDLAVDGECHVDAEGSAGLDESQYGGDNDEDSSGRMEYVVVKHTGATVGNGDEINGISFGGVGSNTIVKNIETYSTFDDGIELFGGSVNIDNFVAVYVRDDSIDIDEGWNGTINNALVIQSATDGNHCIEADGLGSFDSLTPAEVEAKIAQGLNSRPTINNLTCIVSPNGAATATHDPGAGWRLREGLFPTINDALLISSFAANDTTAADDNYCLRIDNRSQQAALDGDLQLNSVVYACQENSKGQAFGAFASEQEYAESVGNIFATVADGTVKSATAVNDADLQLLEGMLPVYSIDYATSQVDGAAPGAGSTPTSGTFLGALSLGGTDWTANWTYGIHTNNRAQALWFENL